MQQQKLPIQRWQRPLTDLTRSVPPAVKEVDDRERLPSAQESAQEVAVSQPSTPITMIRINSGFGPWLDVFDETWVKRGNVLVLLGIRQAVTKAPFQSLIDSSAGAVKIETSRRHPLSAAPNSDDVQEATVRLKDAYGAIVWQEKIGAGRVIYSATPYLAANAYQNEPGNFKFLAQLVSEPGYPLYVDEYMHGYKDKETVTQAGSDSLVGYFAKTPLLLIAIQTAVLLLLLIWGQNRRFGPAQKLPEVASDNSQAYIQALAEVLQKADGSDFVVSTIGKAEQAQTQRALGLGSTPLDPEVVIAAWMQQTGRPAEELRDFFHPMLISQRLTDRELRLWLEQVKIIRRRLA
jgi:hypothetical protein